MKKLIIIFTLTYLFCSINSKATENTSTSGLEDNQKILKIGVLIPLSGQFKEIGESLLDVIRLAVFEIGKKNIIIYPKDSGANIYDAYQAAKEFEKDGIKVVVGPLFYENLEKLDEIKNITFLTLSNKTGYLPKNTIALGINVNSQFLKIKEFLKKNNLSKTLLLIPKSEFENEIKLALKKQKINFYKIHSYEINPKTITKEIEELTLYKERRKDLIRRIKILEKSDDQKDKKEIEKLKQKDTLGKVSFDSVIVADFGERLKSVLASFAFSDVSNKKIKFITLNQWYNESFFDETFAENLHFPSIGLDNFESFMEINTKIFNKTPPEISILAYDAIGLIYYAWNKNNYNVETKYLNIKYGFKGKQGEFIIKNNISYQKLKMYKISERKFINVD